MLSFGNPPSSKSSQITWRMVASGETQPVISGNLPVFQPQAGNTTEFTGIVRYQNGVAAASNGGYHQVVGPDWCTLTYQIGADHSVLLRATIVKGEASQRSEKARQKLQIRLDALTASGTKQQFCFDDTAQPNLLWGVG